MLRKGSTAGVAFVLFLLVLLGISLYFLYLNLTAEPIEFITRNPFVNDPEIVNKATGKQFYKNMRFTDREISYSIESVCGVKTQQAQRAFDILSDRTVLSFYPDDSDPQITILCSDTPNEPAIDEGYFVAGEGGPTKVINTSLYAVIFEGEVSLFRDEKCDEPKIAIHEILHVLGFDHNSNPNSILYPTLDCDQDIDVEIIDSISKLYSHDELADLRIERVSAQKTGRYLNFDIEVANQGLKDSNNVELSVLHNGELVEFDDGNTVLQLGSIEVGTKKILTVTNAKISRSSDRISFIVDMGDGIEELFEDNNELELVLGSS